jgi:hypothetical protein
MEPDVTFLTDYDGLDPAFRLVNEMGIVDSLTVLDRLETESTHVLMTVSRKRPAFYIYGFNFLFSLPVL